MSRASLLELVLLGFLWGSSYIFMRIAVPEFGAVALVSVRMMLAGLCLLPWLIYSGLLSQCKPYIKTLTFVGVFNFALPFFLLAYASITFSAGYTSIINATAPLWTALVGVLWWNLQLSKVVTFGLLLGFFGVAAMVMASFGVAEFSYDDPVFWLALVAGLAAPLSYGSITLYVKQQLHGVPAMITSGGSILTSAMMLLPFGIYYWPQQSPSLSAWLAAIALAVFCTSLAIVLFFRLIDKIGPTKTITVTYLIPVFGMGLGALLLSEPVTIQMLLGCGLILLGVSLATGLVGKPK